MAGAATSSGAVKRADCRNTRLQSMTTAIMHQYTKRGKQQNQQKHSRNLINKFILHYCLGNSQRATQRHAPEVGGSTTTSGGSKSVLHHTMAFKLCGPAHDLHARRLGKAYAGGAKLLCGLSTKLPRAPCTPLPAGFTHGCLALPKHITPDHHGLELIRLITFETLRGPPFISNACLS